MVLKGVIEILQKKTVLNLTQVIASRGYKDV